MKFGQGQLTIYERCSQHTTATFGTTGYPHAILVLQTDGNLVIYKTSDRSAANALWASKTSSNTGDTMYLQPDGNLVIYGTNSSVLWSSGTYNLV